MPNSWLTQVINSCIFCDKSWYSKVIEDAVCSVILEPSKCNVIKIISDSGNVTLQLRSKFSIIFEAIAY